MRRLSLAMLLAILLQACSGIPFLGATSVPTNTSGPTATATITATPTITSTATVTLTITPSPTIVHFPTQDPSLPTATFVPIPIFIGNETATPVVITTPTPVKPGSGFESVQIGDPKIFWGNCNPNKTTIYTTVEDPETVTSVVVFVQVKSTKEDDYTPWSSGNVMYNNGNGSFTYKLEANEIEGHNHYKESWVRYQLVATDIDGEEVGRTQIYTESILLSPCMCYEPLAPGGCPIEPPKAKP